MDQTSTPGPDVLAVAATVGALLDGLAVPWVVEGSLGLSPPRLPRWTYDVFLLAELQEPHVEPVLAALPPDLSCPEADLRRAVARRRSFDLV